MKLTSPKPNPWYANGVMLDVLPKRYHSRARPTGRFWVFKMMERWYFVGRCRLERHGGREARKTDLRRRQITEDELVEPGEGRDEGWCFCG